MNDQVQKGLSLMSYASNAFAGLFGLLSPNTWLVIISILFTALTWYCNFYYQKRRFLLSAKEDERNAELHALDVKLKQAQLKQMGE